MDAEPIDNQTKSYLVRVTSSTGTDQWRDSGYDLTIIKFYVKYTVARPG